MARRWAASPKARRTIRKSRKWARWATGPGRAFARERLCGAGLHRPQWRRGDVRPASDSRMLQRPVAGGLYTGIDPLPDTFKDNAQALADGKLGPDGVFHASKVQAKCASKYEAKPQMKKDAKPGQHLARPNRRLVRPRSILGGTSSNGKYRRSRRFCWPSALPSTP